jgi:hypothetical protein
MAQKFAVAAGDHGEAVLDEVDGAVAQRRGFPGIGGNTRCAVDDVGDLAVARTVCAAIDGLQHVTQSSALLSCLAGIGEEGAVVQHPPEPRNGVDAIEAVGVERNKGRERLIEPRAADQENGDRRSALSMDHT